MGDVGDDFRAMREYRRAAKDRNTAIDETVIVPGDWTEHHRTHRSRVLDGDRLDWWPTARKWRWRGKTVHGSSEALVGFIRKRDPAPKLVDFDIEF